MDQSVHVVMSTLHDLSGVFKNLEWNEAKLEGDNQLIIASICLKCLGLYSDMK